MRHHSPFIASIALLLIATAINAQDKPASGLTKSADGSAFTHAASKSSFAAPKGWEVVPPQTIGKTSFVGLRRNKLGDNSYATEVAVSWSPLEIGTDDATALDQAQMLEHQELTMRYGSDKVGKPESATAGDKGGFKITVDDGPTRNGKEAGVSYIFVTGPNDNRWKIKLRATVRKLTQEESLKEVAELLKSFKW